MYALALAEIATSSNQGHELYIGHDTEYPMFILVPRLLSMGMKLA